jgi:hypothetical protein
VLSPVAHLWRYTHGRLEIVQENDFVYEIVINSLDGKQAARWQGKGRTVGPKLRPGVYMLQMLSKGTMPRKTIFSVIEK